MHNARIPSVIFSTALILVTLSGSSCDSGPQTTNNLSDEALILQNQLQPQTSLSSEDVEEEKRGWKDLPTSWGKRAWKDLHSGGWGKRDWKDLNGGWGKRSWTDLQPSWGKRGWKDLQGSWGKRAWKDLRGGGWGKRDWNQFHGSWGKRDNLYMDDSYENDLDEPDNYYDDEELDDLQEDKRSWNSLKGQWGKRGSGWSKFKGSWGKRDPAWNNLKGLWGKRTNENKWNKLQAVWGKRSIGVNKDMVFPDSRDLDLRSLLSAMLESQEKWTAADEFACGVLRAKLLSH